MNPLIRWLIALSALLWLGQAAALQPVDGTEVVVTDAAGHQLVGYGVVKSGLLMLRVGNLADQFVLLVVAPDGTVQRFDGIRGAGGALLVDQPDGSRERLSSMLSRADVALRLVHQGSGSNVRAGGSSEGGSSETTASSGDGGTSTTPSDSGGSTSSDSGSSGSSGSSSGDTSSSSDTSSSGSSSTDSTSSTSSDSSSTSSDSTTSSDGSSSSTSTTSDTSSSDSSSTSTEGP